MEHSWPSGNDRTSRKSLRCSGERTGYAHTLFLLQMLDEPACCFGYSMVQGPKLMRGPSRWTTVPKLIMASPHGLASALRLSNPPTLPFPSLTSRSFHHLSFASLALLRRPSPARRSTASSPVQYPGSIFARSHDLIASFVCCLSPRFGRRQEKVRGLAVCGQGHQGDRVAAKSCCTIR